MDLAAGPSPSRAEGMGRRRYSRRSPPREGPKTPLPDRHRTRAGIPAPDRCREHRRSPPGDGIRTGGRNEAMNVLLVTTDQQRADTIGAYGSRLAATPNLDRLAAAGVRFDACRTQNPYCQPSRATILTGRYPSRHGVYSNGVDFPHEDVGTTLSALLAAAGWATAFRGKAHFASTIRARRPARSSRSRARPPWPRAGAALTWASATW